MASQRYGRLTVVDDATPILQTNGKRKRAVLARCDCGTERVFVLTNLRSGNSKSCGCHKYDGMAAFNADRATPQKWVIDGVIAYIRIGRTKVLIDTIDLKIVDRYRWGLNNGYAVARGGRIAMHRLILGLKAGDPREVDHVHRKCADNRRSELRIASSSQNKMNRRGNVNSGSVYKGVHFDPARKRFVAQIKGADGHRFIGRFRTDIEAARAYNAAALEHFGPFAYLNLI